MKVLIADGSFMVADRLTTAMREIPEVEVLAPTCDAQTTLESMRTNNPEVLIVDASMAGVQGMNLFQSIRRENPVMVLIILSNLVYPQSRQHYQAAGADLFMDKSNDFTRLYQLVRELVGDSQIAAGRASDDGVRHRLGLSKLKVGLQFVLFALSAASHFR